MILLDVTLLSAPRVAAAPGLILLEMGSDVANQKKQDRSRPCGILSQTYPSFSDTPYCQSKTKDLSQPDAMRSIQVFTAYHHITLSESVGVSNLLFKYLVIIPEKTPSLGRGWVHFLFLFQKLDQSHSNFVSNKIVSIGSEVNRVIPKLFPIRT